MRVFLDTNILLDNLVDRGDERLTQNANLILQLGHDGVIELYMSILSIPTIAYVLKNMTASAKKNIIRGLCSCVSVLPSLSEHVQDMLDGPVGDIEDALQVCSSKEGQCDLIVTRNMSDFRDADIPVMSPEEFLNRIIKQ